MLHSKQLILSPKILKQIGFKKRIIPATPETEEECATKKRIVYEMPTINGLFYYNQSEAETGYQYVWYHKTILGDSANYVLLDIQSLPSLYSVLQVFKVKFNLVIA